VWIDHHKSAIESFYKYLENCELLQDKSFAIFKSFVTPVLEIGRAACEIAWEYLFPDKEMPQAILLLGKYDTWRENGTEEWENSILPFQFGMRAICNSAETFPQGLLLNKGKEGMLVGPIVRRGEDILMYQKQINETACRRSFPAMFKDLRVICLNGGGFNSQAFDSVWDEEKYDAMMPFQYDGEKYNFSLYTTKDIDLSAYAKVMGGGGHAKACGFSFKDLSILNR
jgi:oligoribonuclease NrnB/cAMP/cGMP phosphodiesterase (DHH superfamily)